MIKCILFVLSVLVIGNHLECHAQGVTRRDTVIYNITYRDTTIYRYKTVVVTQYVHTDTLSDAHQSEGQHKRKLINQNSWGIGPSIGAYYSPFNGFDLNIGFGIQYYLLSVPSFRNPHLGHRRKK